MRLLVELWNREYLPNEPKLTLTRKLLWKWQLLLSRFRGTFLILTFQQKCEEISLKRTYDSRILIAFSCRGFHLKSDQYANSTVKALGRKTTPHDYNFMLEKFPINYNQIRVSVTGTLINCFNRWHKFEVIIKFPILAGNALWVQCVAAPHENWKSRGVRSAEFQSRTTNTFSISFNICISIESSSLFYLRSVSQ